MTEKSLTIRPLGGTEEAQWCAHLMANSEPWITLQRDYAEAYTILIDPEMEHYVATIENELAGFVTIVMKGSFTGYLKTLAVASEFRRQGVGHQLIAFAENRIFSEFPNVFICVSSFNPDAKRLYESLGYKVIGLLPDFVVDGHGEYLLRKSIAPLSKYQAQQPASGSSTAVSGDGEKNG